MEEEEENTFMICSVLLMMTIYGGKCSFFRKIKGYKFIVPFAAASHLALLSRFDDKVHSFNRSQKQNYENI